MSTSPAPARSDSSTTGVVAEPLDRGARITNLDAVRGVAVLGILVMNAVSYGLPSAAYFNLDAAGSATWLDWVIGVAGEVFVDQKTMALFSMLFGAGIVLFADRAEEKGSNGTRLSLWRNALLLGIGLAHGALWDGDVLVVYALCAPLLVAVRHRSPRGLAIAGVALVTWSGVLAALVQTSIGPNGAGLGDYWLVDGSSMSDAVGLFLINDFFARALGMMLIGVSLYRWDVMQGRRSRELSRRLAVRGLGVGLPIAAAGVAMQAAFDFDPSIALVGEIPNTLATIPVALGYLGLITLWNDGGGGVVRERVRAVGRMALTNYLTQTILGIVVLRGVLGDADLTRTHVAGFVIAVWVVQLAWSKPWLERFRFGPFEWLWRCATYRRWQPLRR